jgi:pimeloyl-ACP methyl ester carboxylesterase
MKASPWRCRARRGLAILAIWFLIAIFVPLADWLILYPNRESVDPQGAVRRTVAFEDGVLEIWTARSRGAATRPAELFVLSFVGNAARAEWTASGEAHLWKDRPVEVWAVNYPGYGGSTGPARLARLAPAGEAAFADISQVAAGRPIVLGGQSLGGCLALRLASQHRVAGVLLQNPPPLRQMILGRFGWWNLWVLAGPIAMKVPSELDAIANASACRAPAAFFSSEHDEVVPVEYQQCIIDAYGGPKRLWTWPGADHNVWIGDRGDLVEEALAWLWAQTHP